MANYIADESPNVATQAQAPAGRCIDLDGVDDYVNLPALGLLTQFTFAIWVKTTAANGALIGNLDNTAGGAALYLASGQLRLYVSAAGLHFMPSLQAINDGNWHHVVGTWNGTAAKIYVDGVDRSGTQGGSMATPVSTAGGWKIGAYAASPVGFLDGLAFDARIYDRPLAALEVAAMFATARPGGNPASTLYAADLVGHWRLDEGRAKVHPGQNVCYDSSGNQKHGASNSLADSSAYQGDDVPFSWHAEHGYSKLTDLSQLDAFGTSLEDYGDLVMVPGGTTPPNVSQETFKGIANVWRFDFPAAPDMGVNGCRVNKSGNLITMAAANKYFAGFKLFFSRPLTGSEELRAYYTGGLGIGEGYIGANDPVDFTDWIVFANTIRNGADAASVSPWLFLWGTWSGRPLTVWMADASFHQANAGFVHNTYLPELFPQDDSAPTKDIIGDDLQYVGPLARQAAPFDSQALQLNSGAYVSCGDVADIDWSAKRTFRFTMRRSRVSASETVILKRTGNSTDNGSAAGAGIFLHFSSSNSIKLTVDDGSNYQTFTSTDTYQDTQWHDYVLEFNTDKTINLWRDGLLILAATATVNSMANAANLRFGNDSLNLLADVAHFAVDGILDLGFGEGSGSTIYNRIAGGSHATLVNGTWTPVQAVKHHNLMDGFRIANATGSGRTLNGTNQSWNHADNAAFRGGGNSQSMWWAVQCTPDLAAIRTIVSKLLGTSGQYEWTISSLTNGNVEFISSPDGTTLSFISRAGLTNNVEAFVFLAYDHVAGKVYIMIDDQAQDAGTACSGIYAGSQQFNVGVRNGGVYYGKGAVGLVAMGKPSAPLDWTATRNAIRNGGTPLTYDNLTTEQKSQWGLTCWYDCDEYEPAMRDKHSDALHLTGAGIPRIPAYLDGSAAADGGIITNPAGAWHNGAETKINFAPVASPWRSHTYLGLASTTGQANGPDVSGAIVGQVSNRMSIYAKFRYPELTGGNRTFFEADNGATAHRMVAMLTVDKQVALFDGQFRVFADVPQSKLLDDEWHEALFVIEGTTARLYFDSVDMGTVTVNSLATAAAQWTRANILANAGGIANRFYGDIARIKVTATSEIPSTLHAALPLLDVRFDHGRIADINGGVEVVQAKTGLAFAKVIPPASYQYRNALPYGMTKATSGVKESRFSLYNIDV